MGYFLLLILKRNRYLRLLDGVLFNGQIEFFHLLVYYPVINCEINKSNSSNNESTDL